MPKYRPVAERFWEKVSRGQPNECWKWTGAKHKNGYGVISNESKKITCAHRISWTLHFGYIPNNLWVLHKCDNPECVNPSHLFLGTQLENMRDCSQKNRTISGVRHPHAKLNPLNVVQARRLASVGVPYSKLARIFDVSIATAWNAVNGINWRRVS